MDQVAQSPFKIQRLGVVMRPDPNRPEELEGVLNPGAARGPDGKLYLFPRLVGKNNFSRIGLARVIFDAEGTPVDVERLGIALEPEEPYELRPQEGTGGCEDPRVTFIEAVGLYVMAYVAWGPKGPRIALAISEDCLAWERLGLVDFQPDVKARYGVIFNNYQNKDGAFGPDVVELQDGTKVLGLFHRPFYGSVDVPKGIQAAVPSIWVSGCELEWAQRDIRYLRVMRRHSLVIDPNRPWEELRIGIGTPPVRTPLGYMAVYHGVSGVLAHAAGEKNRVNYVAGVLILRREKDHLMRYRTTTPVLIPEVGEETMGVVDNVVFPTGIDDRKDGTYDIYYGMADKYIGVARMWLPNALEEEEVTDFPEASRLNRLKL